MMTTIQVFKVVDRLNGRALHKTFLLNDSTTGKRSVVSITKDGSRTEHIREASEYSANMEFMRLIIDAATNHNLILRNEK